MILVVTSVEFGSPPQRACVFLQLPPFAVFHVLSSTRASEAAVPKLAGSGGCDDIGGADDGGDGGGVNAHFMSTKNGVNLQTPLKRSSA